MLIPATFQPRDEGEANELMALLADTLGTRYAFSRELGGGGMSRVFLAQELALSREVVVKVLRPDLAYGLSDERFAREVRFAARLQQANIVPLLAAVSRSILHKSVGSLASRRADVIAALDLLLTGS